MFVHLPGRSRAEAFRIGAEMAAAVTAANPKPVKLQLEKVCCCVRFGDPCSAHACEQVYEPCILVTKKRYVGMSYASASSETPSFDAKGIETVRRDSCGLVAKTMERSLRLLFATHDLGVVRKYLERQWTKVLAGRMSVADAVFAKEVRLGTYAADRTGVKSSLPLGALVAERARARDPRAVPPYGQRVPYVVVEGLKDSSVSSMVHSPHDFFKYNHMLNAEYYIKLQCNALSRLLNLAGANVEGWRHALPVPRTRHARTCIAAAAPGHGATERTTIPAFFASNQCSVRPRQLPPSASQHLTPNPRAQVCGAFEIGSTLCKQCREARPDLVLLVLHGRASKLETQVAKVDAIWCAALAHARCLPSDARAGRSTSCGGDDGQGSVTECVSLDCPVLYERHKRAHELASCQEMLRQATSW
jgi:DNA polymerase zeta